MLNYQMLDISSLDDFATDITTEEVELLAQMILKVGRTLKPIIVKAVRFDRYDEKFEVIAGHREALAVKRAKQINPKFEFVDAWVFEKNATDDEIKDALKQLRV